MRLIQTAGRRTVRRCFPLIGDLQQRRPFQVRRVYRYVEAEDFEILLLAYAFNEDESSGYGLREVAAGDMGCH